MDGRIADIEGHRLPSELALNCADSRGRLVQGLVPANGLESVADAPHGRPEPVWVGVEVLEGDALGAEVTSGEDVLRIAPD